MENITQALCIQLFEYRDGCLYWKRGNTRRKAGDKAGCLDKKGYVQVKIFRKPYKAHRIIFLMSHGWLPRFIDHIDGNPANNRVENLRACTQQQNVFNSSMRSTNTSGYIGVSWDKSANKWRASVRVGNKTTVVGRFDTAEIASEERTRAAKMLHGEFFRG